MASTTGSRPPVTLAQRRLRRERRRPLSRAILERNERVLHHLGLAHLAAQRQIGRGSGEYEDLLQEAQIGLIRAAEKFDPRVGTRISSYVMPLAIGQIMHFRRDRERCLRIPWRLSDLHAKGARLQECRQHQHKPALTDAQVADALGVRTERWQQARMAHQQQQVVSLHQFNGPSLDHRGCSNPESSSNQQPGTWTNRGEALIDHLLAPTHPGEGDPQLEWLHHALKEWPRPVQRWLIEHHVHNRSIQTIATAEGVPARTIRRTLKACLARLREQAAEQWPRRLQARS